MRLHLVGFPHTRVSPAFSTCAYTMKVLKFAKMMGDRHDVFVYATEGSEAPGATEVVPLLSDAERTRIFGADDPNALPAWPSEDEWRLFNARAIAEILPRAEPHDLILLAAGRSQQGVHDAFPELTRCEPGVGYEGIFTPFCAFESYAWMHYLYATIKQPDGRWFDAVIPNYFDADEFPKVNPGAGKYLMYCGRLIQRKGAHIAAQIARELGMKLVVAGPGAVVVEKGRVASAETTLTGDVEYVGVLNPLERNEIMAGAHALLCPTVYIEPFGGVAVEAMMSGTPAIATDWGAFTETVADGVSGFRFRTLAEGLEAVENAAELDNDRIREWAISRYSLEAVAPQFDRWFAQLDSLRGKGWDALPAREAVSA